MPDASPVTLVRCPGCDLVMSRTRVVPVDDEAIEWQCWSCGHVFGCMIDGGTLDLKLVRVDPRSIR